MTKCPLCETASSHFHTVDNIAYYECTRCDFIFADPEFLKLNDEGGASREYGTSYWQAEVLSARTRSYGSSLARFAEAVLYTRIPIEKCIDIGTGPGYLVHALQTHLPSSAKKFYGVEKFPPPETAQSRLTHPENYIVGMAGDLNEKFQLGTCIEVIEHLTPTMLRGLARQMKKISVSGSFFIFNTGLTEYVRNGNLPYLDPLRRGHITSWSIRSLKPIFNPEGFAVYAVEGKPWAFAVEYEGSEPGNLLERIWTTPPENKKLLEDEQGGSLLYVLALDTARASAYAARNHRMALALQAQAG
jgi:hypothetical protein